MHPRLRFPGFATKTLLLSLIFWQLPYCFPRSLEIAQAQDIMPTLLDGNYQFCSQPETKDSPLGAGICFWFRKVNNRVVGYYGYPQSDDSICVSGEVKGNLATGEALAVSWPGSPWEKMPQSSFDWDEEGRLKLNHPIRIHNSESVGGSMDWIQFRSAVLNFEGFSRYRQVSIGQDKIPESCSVKDITKTWQIGNR